MLYFIIGIVCLFIGVAVGDKLKANALVDENKLRVIDEDGLADAKNELNKLKAKL